MKPIKTISALLMLAALSFPCRGEYAPMPKVVISMQKKAFQGKSPEEIASFLAHPDESTQKAAAAALADNPATAMPLIEKLLTDTNPWIRAGAVDVMTNMVEAVVMKRGPQIAPSPLSKKQNGNTTIEEKKEAQLKLTATRLLQKYLSEETESAVLNAICSLFRKASFDPEVLAYFVKKAILSEHPSTRINALKVFEGRNHSEKDLLWAGLLALERYDGSIHQEILSIMNAVECGMQQENGNTAIPAIASHLLNKVNGGHPAFRKKYWFQVVDQELNVLEKHWSWEVEKQKDVVPGLCRAVVRLPYNKGGRHVKYNLRERSKILLRRCSWTAAPVIRESAEKELEWLNSASDVDLKEIVTCLSTEAFNPEKARENCRDSIVFLKLVADKLEVYYRIKPEGNK